MKKTYECPCIEVVEVFCEQALLDNSGEIGPGDIEAREIDMSLFDDDDETEESNSYPCW